jgi:hypothetical protein
VKEESWIKEAGKIREGRTTIAFRFGNPIEAVRRRLLMLFTWVSSGVPAKTGRIRNLRDALTYMLTVTLSTGITLLSDHVHSAEYYPSGSLLNSAFINGELARREENFLQVRTVHGAVCVRGATAADDAGALQKAGIHVYRRAVPAPFNLGSARHSGRETPSAHTPDAR